MPVGELQINEGERRFLTAISRKYRASEPAALVRSYAMAGLVLLALFTLARWISSGLLALCTF
jgi:hypothetical protein